MSPVTINLPKHEKERLNRLALSFGLSLSELSCRVLGELALNLPEESFSDYKNPKALKASFGRAIANWHAGRTTDRL